MQASDLWNRIRRGLWLCAWVAAIQVDLLGKTGSGADKSLGPESLYAGPEVLTAAIYTLGSETNPPLFKFKRTITKPGSALHVLREYSYPDGRLAARERLVYRQSELARYELEELQNGGAGSAMIQKSAGGVGRDSIIFRYAKNASRLAGSGTRTEPLASDTLVNDMVGVFLSRHWDRLARGEKLKCRYLVVPRRETVGFIFRKESEGNWQGREVIRVKMEPSSLVISALVDPLQFVVEKAPPHRVLEYIGRTTPKTGGPGHWSDLDARTVFDW